MGIEVERKFLVRGDGWRQFATGSAVLRQFYLIADAESSIRVRSASHAAWLTLKFGKGERARAEFEYPIPVGDVDQLAQFSVAHAIEKTRYRVPHRGRLYEVDVFAGDLAGLVLAELETPEDVPDDELPEWLGREGTGEPAFYNAAMARNGLPPLA